MGNCLGSDEAAELEVVKNSGQPQGTVISICFSRLLFSASSALRRRRDTIVSLLLTRFFWLEGPQGSGLLRTSIPILLLIHMANLLVFSFFSAAATAAPAMAPHKSEGSMSSGSGPSSSSRSAGSSMSSIATTTGRSGGSTSTSSGSRPLRAAAAASYREEEEEEEEEKEGRILEAPNLRIFTFAELRAATRNFRPDTVLGEGGFGRVYKGWVDERTMNPTRSGIGMVVAVKKLNQESVQGLQEWQVRLLLLATCHQLASLLHGLIADHAGRDVRGQRPVWFTNRSLLLVRLA
jgi:hypothetical protein